MIHPDKYYVFYDGECGFCNRAVQWILKRDEKDQFLFASLQSEFGKEFLKERGLNPEALDTLYLWKPTAFYYTKSQAAFSIMKILGGSASLLSYFSVLPAGLTDFFYDQVSKNRKSLASNSCELPSEKDRKKFIT